MQVIGGLDRIGHIDTQDVTGVLREGLGDVGEGLSVGGLVRIDGDGKFRQGGREDADPEVEVAVGIDSEVVGHHGHARLAVRGKVFRAAQVDDDVAGEFGAALTHQDDVPDGLTLSQRQGLEGDVAMGHEAGPFDGNGAGREAAVGFDRLAGHQVRGGVEGTGRRRLDLGDGGMDVRRVAEVRARDGGIDGIEAVLADEVRREVAGNGEMRGGTALCERFGRVQIRAHPVAAHGVCHADGVAGGPFQGLPGPAGAGLGGFAGKDEGVNGSLRPFVAAENGQRGHEGCENHLSHG